MELQFQKVNENEWVAEFQATADFNLHIERVSSGSITVAQRGTESGEYDTAWAKGVYEGQRVIDYDFGALVYPKWIKVTSSSEVVSCVVNFSAGGGSGTGGGSGEAASSVEYLDVSGHSEQRKLIVHSTLANTPMGVMPSAGLIEICLNMGGLDVLDQVTKIAVSPTLEITFNGVLQTISSVFEGYDSIPRITKEEFYAI